MDTAGRIYDEWIKSLRIEYDVTHPSDPTPQTQMQDAFVRILAEIEIIVEKLNRTFSHGFKIIDLDPGSLLVRARITPGPWSGTLLTFDWQTATMTSHPTADFTRELADHHAFRFNHQTGSFTENEQNVTDREVVTRALNMFVRSALGLTKA